MNLLSKIDSVLPTIEAEVTAHWSAAAVVGVAMVVICAVLALKVPAIRHAMRVKMRPFRYCHDCIHNDLLTETCDINADRNERCGVIDTQAGMDFTVTKN